MKAVEVDLRHAIFGGPDDRAKPLTEEDFRVLVRASRLHSLRERLVEGTNEDQKFGFGFIQLLLRPSKERTGDIDRMHDRPTQMKELQPVPLEIELIELTGELARSDFLLADHHEFGLDIDKLVLPGIRDPEHEARDLMIRRDEGMLAEENAGDWSGKSAIKETGGKCEGHETGQRFKRGYSVCQESYRRNAAVADRRERLSAEEETFEIAGSKRVTVDASQPFNADREIRKGEDRVQRDEARQDQKIELQPWHLDESMVEAEGLKEPKSVTPYVEATIAIEQSRLCFCSFSCKAKIGEFLLSHRGDEEVRRVWDRPADAQVRCYIPNPFVPFLGTDSTGP